MKATLLAAGCRRGLALKKPRTIPGITDENIAYNFTRTNLDEYDELGIADMFPEPSKEELIAVIHDTIESYSGGVCQAGWEIHCYLRLLKMLEGGAA